MTQSLCRSLFVLLVLSLVSCDQLTDTTVRVGRLQIVEGDNITAAVGSEVTATARVEDGNGDPIEGYTADFEVVSGGGSVSPQTVTTDGDGRGTVAWILGTTPGPQRLRAHVGAFQLTFSATAEAGPLASLVANEGEIGFTALQQTQTLSVSGVDEYGNAVDVSGTSWSSGNTSVAQVSGAGEVTAIGVGSTSVTATNGSINTNVAVVVEQVVDHVSVDPTGGLLSALGDTLHLTATAFDANDFEVADETSGWSSGNPSVATVNAAGIVTAVAAGTADITASAGDESATVTVSVAPTVTTVTVDPETVSFTALGATAPITGSALDANGNAVAGATLTWSSLNLGVAAVSTSGVITSVGEGTTHVLARISTITGSIVDSVQVTVTPVVDSLGISTDSLHFAAIGDTLTVEARGYDTNGNDLGAQTVTWSTTDTGIATADNSGRVVSVANGSARLIAALSPTLVDTAAIGVMQEVFAVTVAPALDTLYAVGDTVHMTGTAADSNGFAVDTALTWSSSDTTVATVDASGVVTGVGVGTAEIVGAVAGLADTAEVVVQAAVTSLSVAPDTVEFTALDDTTTLAVTALDAEANPVDAALTWTSLAPGIATVDGTGLVTAVAAGITQVVTTTPAAGGGTLADTTVVIVAQVLATIAIDPDAIALASLGETVVAVANGYDANGNLMGQQSATFTTLDPGIASVDGSGLVTAVTNGSTELAADAGGLVDTVAVDVFQVVASVVVAPTSDTLVMEDTVGLSTTVLDALGNAVVRAYTVTWDSDDTGVATVDPAGAVTGVMVGGATVSATVDGVIGGAGIQVAPHPSDALSVTTYAACALDVDGTAYCWGDNRWAQIGDGTGATLFADAASEVAGGHVFQQLVGNGWVTCGLDTSGQAYCWGDNGAGNIGNGVMDGLLYDTPEPVTGGHTFTHLEATWEHVCAIDDAGAAWCWGRGDEDQLGDGLGTTSATPVQVAGGLTFHDLGMGRYFSCGLTGLGEVYCWGQNSDFQFGDGTTTPSATPVLSAGGQTFANIDMDWWGGCGVKSDGSALCWGYNGNGRVGDGTTTNAPSPVAVAGGFTWRSLNPANGWTCGLTDGGTVTCVGVNSRGQAGTGDFNNLATHTAIASGETYVAVDTESGNTCALSDTGTLRCMGEAGGAGVYWHTPTYTYAGVNTMNGISARGSHSCSWNSTSIYCWGSNDAGQLGNGGTTPTAIPTLMQGSPTLVETVATGYAHTCYRDNGQIYCVGDNFYGQLGDGTTTGIATAPAAPGSVSSSSDISAGANHTCSVNDLYGEIECWGDNGYYQSGDPISTDPVTGVAFVTVDTGFVDVEAGGYHTCGIDELGRAWCWGLNNAGQLGAVSSDLCGAGSDIDCSATPIQVSGGLTFSSLSGGLYHTCGITTGGDTYCWGQGTDGQLGDGIFTSSTTPVLVAGGHSFGQVSAMGGTTCARAGISLYCWGRNSSYQLVDGTTDPSGVPVLVAGLGTADVAGSSGHICAVADDAEVYCWGYRNYGQTADGMAFLNTPTSVPHAISLFTSLSPLTTGPDVYLSPTSSGITLFSGGASASSAVLHNRDGAPGARGAIEQQ